jgi:ribosome biogenesis protein SSF1/2
VKPVVKKKQPTVDHITGDKIPKSFVFARGKLPGPLRQLQMDLRKLMLPYTALNLKVKIICSLCCSLFLFLCLLKLNSVAI